MHKEGSSRVLLNAKAPAESKEMPSSTAGVFILGGQEMKQEEEMALKVTKEIVIKFIEIGRLSVNSFDEVFRQVHTSVLDTITEGSIKTAD